jgi:hypothetical protein
MTWVAKPYLNKNVGIKEFPDVESAVAYLEEFTGHKMDFVRNKKTKVKTYDWELIGKLYRKKA